MLMVGLAALSCAIFVFSTYLKGLGLVPYVNALQEYLLGSSAIPTDDDNGGDGDNNNGGGGYDDQNGDDDDGVNLRSGRGFVVLVLFSVDQLTNLCFIADYLLSCIGSDRLVHYVTSPIGVCDLLSGIPVTMVMLQSPNNARLQSTGFVRALKFLKVGDERERPKKKKKKNMKELQWWWSIKVPVVPVVVAGGCGVRRLPLPQNSSDEHFDPSSRLNFCFSVC
jgi:hypothetical protein